MFRKITAIKKRIPSKLTFSAIKYDFSKFLHAIYGICLLYMQTYIQLEQVKCSDLCSVQHKTANNLSLCTSACKITEQESQWHAQFTPMVVAA